MNAVAEYMSPLTEEKVVHVAFRCGCVRTIRNGMTMLNNCPIHKENMTSFTEERVPSTALPPVLDLGSPDR